MTTSPRRAVVPPAICSSISCQIDRRIQRSLLPLLYVTLIMNTDVYFTVVAAHTDSETWQTTWRQEYAHSSSDLRAASCQCPRDRLPPRVHRQKSRFCTPSPIASTAPMTFFFMRPSAYCMKVVRLGAWISHGSTTLRRENRAANRAHCSESPTPRPGTQPPPSPAARSPSTLIASPSFGCAGRREHRQVTPIQQSVQQTGCSLALLYPSSRHATPGVCR